MFSNFLLTTITHKQTPVAIFHTTQTLSTHVTHIHKYLLNCTKIFMKIKLTGATNML